MEVFDPNKHVRSPDKVGKSTRSPPSVSKPVSTTEKQSMAYVTVRNIENDTSYMEKDWSLFILKELQDNAWDWLNDYYYPTTINMKAIRKIAVRIWITNEGEDQGVNIRFVHIAVRNSNVGNIPAFEDLFKTFDFKSWHSTKRYQHRMTCGSLGDALKRCLGMGYASWTKDYNPNETFEDKEWNEPVIIMANGFEFKAFIKVDIARSHIRSEVIQEKEPTRNIGNDTEVEVTLPILNSVDDDWWWIGRLEKYYKKSKIGKSTRTDFSITIGNEIREKQKVG